MPDVRSVAIGFFVGTGSRDESGELAGASHFLEHLLFKGTESWSAADIAEALDGVGGDCNAFTTKEYTAFYVRLLSEDLDLGLEILGNIMLEPALRRKDVDAERKVILDEILMHADEPGDQAGERFQSALFLDHPLGRDTLGTKESIADITSTDVRAFFDRHYLPRNMVVSVAGSFDHETVAAKIDRQFSNRSGGSAPLRVSPGAAQKPLVVTDRPTEQVHMVIGARCVSRFDEQRWAFSILSHVLGGGLSSRLFQKVREQRGLVYSIWSERAAFQDAGSIAVAAGTAPEHVEEVLEIVVEELELLAKEGITEKELKIAKGSHRAEALLSCEDSAARMMRIGTALLLHGEVKSIDEILERIERVDESAVAAVASELLDRPRTLSVVGPVEAGGVNLDRVRGSL
ncbi:MAG: M16 family metallopeptidase [Acidimicrobiales bacterium]|jgi:predicted Zn-dependent peptidase